MTQYALGRRVEHDPKSRMFAAAATPVKPRTVTWAHQADVLDQGEVGSCTGNAMAQWLNTDFGGGHRFGEGHALALYELATHLDGFPGSYPPEDTGSSGLGVCKAARKLGYITSYRWTFTFPTFLAALAKSPLIVGTEWTSGMFTPHDGFVRPTGPTEGGHEYLVLGCDTQRKSVTILNSWGPGWGDNGRAHIAWSDMAILLSRQGDVKVPVR